MARRTQIALAVAAVAALAAWWWMGGSSAEREIRRRVDEFVADFNASTTEGIGMVSRAARIGNFFTTDVVVELGQGSAPIHGRETLIGMAARLQPRTAAFVLEVDDLNVTVVEPGRADVTFTALIRRRSVASGEESLDAREFAADMVESDGAWRVKRLAAIDTLR